MKIQWEEAVSGESRSVIGGGTAELGKCDAREPSKAKMGTKRGGLEWRSESESMYRVAAVGALMSGGLNILIQ